MVTATVANENWSPMYVAWSISLKVKFIKKISRGVILIILVTTIGTEFNGK